MGSVQRRIYGLQFHPEVRHTPRGSEIIRNFLFQISRLQPDWTPENIIADAVERIRRQVGVHHAISAVSGGVDSTVATTLAHRAIGNRLSAVFVDTGLLRQGEADMVEVTLKEQIRIPLTRVNASADFFAALRGVTEPEEKTPYRGREIHRSF